MKRISQIGLALAAVMALSAVMVASASALPEFKAAKFPVSFTSENVLPLEPTLSSSTVFGTVTISCQMSKDKGNIATVTTVSKVLVDYTGCKESSGGTCTSPSSSTGLITTRDLNGRIGYLNKTTKTVGTELEPEGGGNFAEFTCATLGKITVTGCTIGEASPTNVSQKTGTLLFEENAGKNGQLFTEIEGGTHKPCEQTVKSPLSTGKGWIMDKETETFAENVELKA